MVATLQWWQGMRVDTWMGFNQTLATKESIQIVFFCTNSGVISKILWSAKKLTKARFREPSVRTENSILSTSTIIQLFEPSQNCVIDPYSGAFLAATTAMEIVRSCIYMEKYELCFFTFFERIFSLTECLLFDAFQMLLGQCLPQRWGLRWSRCLLCNV